MAAAASIDFLAAAHEGDELTAVATELWRTRRNGIYEITVTNQHGARIALFRGRSYRIDGHGGERGVSGMQLAEFRCGKVAGGHAQLRWRCAMRPRGR